MADTIGGTGNDSLQGAGGNDSIDGQSGDDTASAITFTDDVVAADATINITSSVSLDNGNPSNSVTYKVDGSAETFRARPRRRRATSR